MKCPEIEPHGNNAIDATPSIIINSSTFPSSFSSAEKSDPREKNNKMKMGRGEK